MVNQQKGVQQFMQDTAYSAVNDLLCIPVPIYNIFDPKGVIET